MRKIILYLFTVLLPAVAVGISNFNVFADAVWLATIALLVTAGVAAVFNWASGDATPKVRRYAIGADFVICFVLCLNFACHWVMARQVSAAKQGVIEHHDEEDRQDKRAQERTERELALRKADTELAAENTKLQNAERRKLAQLPPSQRRAVITAATPETKPTQTSIVAPMALVPAGTAVSAPIVIKPRQTPDQVRESWWPTLVGLAIAEVFASVLAACILAGLWEWDRNHDGIPDHLQRGAAPGK
jgi:type VI protein secretion system component VasK